MDWKLHQFIHLAYLYVDDQLWLCQSLDEMRECIHTIGRDFGVHKMENWYDLSEEIFDHLDCLPIAKQVGSFTKYIEYQCMTFHLHSFKGIAPLLSNFPVATMVVSVEENSRKLLGLRGECSNVHRMACRKLEYRSIGKLVQCWSKKIRRLQRNSPLKTFWLFEASHVSLLSRQRNSLKFLLISLQRYRGIIGNRKSNRLSTK
jgi:hypothetical protein